MRYVVGNDRSLSLMMCYRGQLPDRERMTCLKLLLRITLQTEKFDDLELADAQEWLTILEGTRRRTKYVLGERRYIKMFNACFCIMMY